VVLEYAGGGDLVDYLYQKGGYLTEMDAVRAVVKPLLAALAYLHGQVWWG
jgi:serine/threonine protein kinase